MSDTTLKTGDVVLVEGPEQIDVTEGEIEVVGARLESGTSMEIPGGKTLPVEALADSNLTFHNGEAGLEHLDGRTIPESWDELVDTIQADQPDCILILGEMDTGKTFFSTYVSNRLLEVSDRVSVMDCDLGQSDIGPPGTVGLAEIEDPTAALDTVEWSDLAFVGAHSPGLHMVPFLSGVRHLADLAMERTDTLMVDTTGWVQGDGGRTIKQGKIDVLDPEYVVLLQKDEELEHLVNTVSEERVKRVTVSDKVSPTPPDERKDLRERSMRHYMEDASLRTLDLDDFGTERIYYKTGHPLEVNAEEVIHAERLSAWEGSLAVVDGFLSEVGREELSEHGQIRTIEPGVEEGILVGLTTEDDVCLGLGIVEEIDYENGTVSVHTPLEDPENKAYRIQFGSIRYTPDGSEAGFVEPGTL